MGNQPIPQLLLKQSAALHTQCRHIEHLRDCVTARSRSGLNFLNRSCYGFTTERDIIINEIGLYFLLAQASGFHTICHYQGFHVSYCSEQPI